MPDLARDFPELMAHVDQTPGMRTTYAAQTIEGSLYLIVTQTSEWESGQILLRREGTTFRHVTGDTVIDFDKVLRPQLKTMAVAGTCGPSTAADHAAVAAKAVEQVGKFSSVDGPHDSQGHNLSCVWAVRNIAFMVLNRWITRQDGTADFYPELKACMGPAPAIDTVPAGALIISPTEDIETGGRNIGHVGILGPATSRGDDRLIYSNSSSAEVWKQNFTVGSWHTRYVKTKHLKMFAYALPHRNGGPSS